VDYEELFKQAVKRLRNEECEFAVCGGLAAIIYRPDVRFTGDIDILLSAPKNTVDLALAIIEDFGLIPTELTAAQLSMTPSMHKRSSPAAVIIGRAAEGKKEPGLDFLMPVLPWAKNALARAKKNNITFAGYDAPFITAEDVVLAKIPALSKSERRGKDWDDIASILNSGRKLDYGYLTAEIERLGLIIPRHLEKELPKPIAVVMNRLRLQKNKGKG
jgi:hypothetical protein